MSSTNAFSVLCESESVGKRVKSSKRKIKWKFILAEEAHETKSHDVVLFHSIMSGKKTVVYDKKTLHVSKKVERTSNCLFDFDAFCVFGDGGSGLNACNTNDKVGSQKTKQPCQKPICSF